MRIDGKTITRKAMYRYYTRNEKPGANCPDSLDT
jgi:hypothetical protein